MPPIIIVVVVVDIRGDEERVDHAAGDDADQPEQQENFDHLRFPDQLHAQHRRGWMESRRAESTVLVAGGRDVSDANPAFAPGIRLRERVVLPQQEGVTDLVVPVHNPKIMGLLPFENRFEQPDPRLQFVDLWNSQRRSPLGRLRGDARRAQRRKEAMTESGRFQMARVSPWTVGKFVLRVNRRVQPAASTVAR